MTFVCTFLPCTHQRPKHCIDEEKGKRNRKRKSPVLTEVISAGFDFLNYNSLIIIQKYLNSLTANTLGTFGSSVEMGAKTPPTTMTLSIYS